MNLKIPDISKLQNEKTLKEKAKKEIFNIVLNKCINDINYTNKFTDKTFILFEVPNIIIGYQHYNKRSCIDYLIDVFKNEGYFVDSKDGYVYIDWGSITNEKNTFIKNDSINSKINNHTLNLLRKKYPNASKVIFEYDK